MYSLSLRPSRVDSPVHGAGYLPGACPLSIGAAPEINGNRLNRVVRPVVEEHELIGKRARTSWVSSEKPLTEMDMVSFWFPQAVRESRRIRSKRQNPFFHGRGLPFLLFYRFVCGVHRRFSAFSDSMQKGDEKESETTGRAGAKQKKEKSPGKRAQEAAEPSAPAAGSRRREGTEARDKAKREKMPPGLPQNNRRL